MPRTDERNSPPLSINFSEYGDRESLFSSESSQKISRVDDICTYPLLLRYIKYPCRERILIYSHNPLPPKPDTPSLLSSAFLRIEKENPGLCPFPSRMT